MSAIDRESRPNLPAFRHPDGQSGHILVLPGDPRYCWNPFRHDPHEFYYTLDDGTTGDYECFGQPAHIDIVIPER